MMSPEMMLKLKRSLMLHEGWKTFPYIDTVGKITIGCGYNLTDRGLPSEWLMDLYNQDVAYFSAQLTKDFKWFSELNEDRQIILIDMCFMGYKKFLSFKKMIAALEKHDYVTAAMEMLDSKWAQEVGKRADDLSKGLVYGEYQI